MSNLSRTSGAATNGNGHASSRLPHRAATLDMFTATRSDSIRLNGHSLTVGQVVGLAKSTSDVAIENDPEIARRVGASVDFLASKVGLSLYGVSTGFGGSADTRSSDPAALQLALIEHQLIGVTPTDLTNKLGSSAFKTTEPMANLMPEAIVRGAMAIRANSLTRGHSAVRYSVLEKLCQLVQNKITPCVPLRGSISASGDLSPLSYVVGTLLGHPDVYVTVTDVSNQKHIMPAADALKQFNIEPIVLGPKEGLGLINGTAFSAAAASLALHDSQQLALMSQILTAMSVEAMEGAADSFHPFLHDIARPHVGQVEVAATIYDLLQGSKFVVAEDTEKEINEDKYILRQDRYALRTSAQWIGPQLESLGLAQKQIETELNTTTDNPLIFVEAEKRCQGGNFQAMSVTQSMESVRLCLEHLGKLSFSQMTELLNCTMNRGLPSCLAGSEPSTNYHCKGLDIASASYLSELGFLANPVSTHVQSAEMHNQQINSLALISGRKTIESADVLTLLMSSHLYAVCQALDLRAADATFRRSLDAALVKLVKTHFGSVADADRVASKLAGQICRSLEFNGSMDLDDRMTDLADACLAICIAQDAQLTVASIKSFRADLIVSLTKLYEDARASVIRGDLSAAPFLGKTKAMYLFVRQHLGISFRVGDVASGQPLATIGRSVTKIYEAFKSGAITPIIADILAHAQ